jgi:pimeloyl-ACP methyl ester carboxylesterase
LCALVALAFGCGDAPTTGWADPGSASRGGAAAGETSPSTSWSSSTSAAQYIRGPVPTALSATLPGPYAVQSYPADATVRQTTLYDVNAAHIYYPIGATAPFAAISFVPGFASPESSIANWGPFLASYGIVVMTIGTSNPLSGWSDFGVLPPVRADALMDALQTIRGEDSRSGSPLAGKIDTNTLGVAGWSMGGGGTLIDANAHPDLKAVMALCAWNPGGTYPQDVVPTLMFGATSDGLAGPPMPQGQYDSIPTTTSKLLYVINGGSHFFANDPTTEPTVARLGLSWMKTFLEGDDRYRPFLTQRPSDADTFETTLQ